MPKIKWSVVWGIFVSIVFLILLLIRLEFFQKNEKITDVASLETTGQPEDVWMNIYQNKNKIGVVHRIFTVREKGFHFDENTVMHINTMGVTQVLNISTSGNLNQDRTLSSFNFDLQSSLFRFNAHGSIAKNKIIIFTGLPGAQQRSEIPIKDIPHISGNIYNAAFRSNLEKDATRSFNIFDPSTLGLRSIKVTRQADEIIPVMGKRIFTRKYCTDIMGAKNCAWLDKDGNTVKESGILGLSMEKVTRDKAFEGTAKSGVIDFTEVASIESNVTINEAEKLNQILIKATGLTDYLPFLNADRQTYRRNIFKITKENLSLPLAPAKDLPPGIIVFLKATPLVQADDPQIKAQLEKIVNPADSPEQKTRKIVNWIYRTVEKKPVLSIPNALEVLKNKVGDCNEHAVLVAALLRAAGIPAQIESGLVYLHGRFYYHAWNIAYLGQWVTADAVFNQFPADVTHIRLVRGEGSEQLDLMGVIGKIKLEVLEQSK